MSNKVLVNSLKGLTQTMAVSGYEWEQGMAQTIQELVCFPGERIGDNLVYTIGNAQKEKICLTAHMDEVGFIITKKDKDFSYILPIGDIDPCQLKKQKLIFLRNEQRIIAQTSKSAKSFARIRIKAPKNQVGDVGTFKKSFSIKKDIIITPSLDNKVSCLVLIELIKKLVKQKLNRTIFFCFTCREEVGLNGLMTAIRQLQPDFCIDLDSAYAQPVENSNNWSVPLIGKGPAIQLMGENFIMSCKNRRLIEKFAQEIKVALQYEITDDNNGATNASTILSAGFDVMQLNIPVANQHTAQSRASITDISEMIRLLTGLLSLEENVTI